jgi:hypothetical protein
MQELSKEEITQLVLKEAKQLQTTVIKNFLQEFGSLRNISPEYNFFNAKQEVVADVSYFPGPKKKYALHIINKENVSVDKKDIKGLIVRRSDYPLFTKIKILELIDMLLAGEKISFINVNKHIMSTREQISNMIESRSKEIARPVSFTKPLSEYKVMPMHIKGIMLWNKIEYNYFEPGTKGYMFRILGIDPLTAPEHIQKNIVGMNIPNNIVIPYEEEKLPDYYIIDKTAMLSFSWDDRVNEMIEPLKDSLGRRRINELAELVVKW